MSNFGTPTVKGHKNVKPKCLIGCSGSVAALKVPELVAELSLHFEVMIICTQSASFFLEKSQAYNFDAWKRFEIVGGWNLVLKDEDEWQMWNMIGHSVLHIEMRRWADVFVIAPASANLIAKASCGIADNFILSVMRAWDFKKPCILCPAMNTLMWDHPVTKTSLDTLKLWGWEVLGPVEKLLACNEQGNGAMISIQAIRDHLVARQLHHSPYAQMSTNTVAMTPELNRVSNDNSSLVNEVNMNTSKLTQAQPYQTPVPVRTPRSSGSSFIANDGRYIENISNSKSRSNNSSGFFGSANSSYGTITLYNSPSPRKASNVDIISTPTHSTSKNTSDLNAASVVTTTAAKKELDNNTPNGIFATSTENATAVVTDTPNVIAGNNSNNNSTINKNNDNYSKGTNIATIIASTEWKIDTGTIVNNLVIGAGIGLGLTIGIVLLNLCLNDGNNSDRKSAYTLFPGEIFIKRPLFTKHS